MYRLSWSWQRLLILRAVGPQLRGSHVQQAIPACHISTQYRNLPGPQKFVKQWTVGFCFKFWAILPGTCGVQAGATSLYLKQEVRVSRQQSRSLHNSLVASNICRSTHAPRNGADLCGSSIVVDAWERGRGVLAAYSVEAKGKTLIFWIPYWSL